MLQELLYADEVRPMSEVPLPDGEVREAELKLAKQLIDQIASETFEPYEVPRRGARTDPGRHRDARCRGTTSRRARRRREPARIIDLMAALKASLGKGHLGGGQGRARPQGRRRIGRS